MQRLGGLWTTQKLADQPVDTRGGIFDNWPILHTAKAWTERGEEQDFKIYFRIENTSPKQAVNAALAVSDTELKLGIAEQYRHERAFYYPREAARNDPRSYVSAADVAQN